MHPSARRGALLHATTLFLPFVLGACAGRATPEDYRESSSSQKILGAEVLAKVNGEAIIRAELDSFARQSALSHKDAELRREMEKNSELRRALLQELVVRRLVLQSANRFGMSVSEAEVEEASRKGVDNSGRFLILTSLSEDDPKSNFLADFRQSVRDELLEIKVFLKLSQEGAIKEEPVTEFSLRALYEGNREQFKGSYAQERDRIDLLLKIEKRRAEHRNLATILFQRSEVIPADLAEMRSP